LCGDPVSDGAPIGANTASRRGTLPPVSARVSARTVVASLALLAAFGAAPRAARADGERNKWIALGLAGGATFAPMVLAQAVALDSATTNAQGEPEASRSAKLAAGALLATGAVLGPSVGFAYAGDWKYAGISAGGKAAILGAGLLVAATRREAPYDNDFATMLPAIAIFVWDVVDFFLIPGAVDRHNRDLQAAPPTPAALTFRW
jgi:hypothetical protein